MPVVAIGISHRTSPVELRERFAFTEAATLEALSALRASGLASEGVILSTCNRVELYAVVPRPDDEALRALRDFLVANRNHPGPAGDQFYLLNEPRSVEHLFRVACGLDSMLLGETEILGQLKQAYDLALRNQQTGPLLNKTFQRAFNVAKQVRTETNIQRGSISVASAAVELAERIFESLNHRRVLVVGAGDTSEKTARALLSRGAREILVTNRSPDRAQALAAELGGRAIPFETWDLDFAGIDILISSTSAPHYVLDVTRLEPLMKLRHQEPILFIDIAVPRDIDPAVNYLDNVYLYNIDDLQAIADDYLKQRQEEITRCEQIIGERVTALLGATRPGATNPQPLQAGPNLKSAIHNQQSAI